MATRAERLKSAQDKRTQHITAAEELLALPEGTLTDEQSNEINTHLDDADTASKEIDALVAEEKADASRLIRLDEIRNRPLNPEVARLVNMGSGLPQQPRGATQDRWSIHPAARHHQRITSFSSDDTYSAEEKAYRFGMYCLAKASADLPSTYRFPTATRFAREQGLYNAAHMEGASDTTGSGVFVPEEFGTDLIKLREEYGAARRLAKVRTMSSDTRTDPKWESGLTAYFVGEGEAGTVSNMVHSSVRLTAKKLMVLATFSSELNEDAVIDIGNELAGEIAYAFALKEDQCLIDGDGTSTYGGIVGLKASFATLTLGTAPGFIDSTTSNTWAAMVLGDLTRMIGVLPTYAHRNASFLCSSQFYFSVMVPLLNAAGGNTGTMLQDGYRTPMFQGYPVILTPAMPIVTGVNAIACFFGDFAQGVTLGDRRRETYEFSKEATIDGVSLFVNDMLAIKGTERIDINVHSFGTDTAAGPIVALTTGS